MNIKQGMKSSLHEKWLRFYKGKFCYTRRNDAVGQGFNRLGMIQWIDSVNLWQFVQLLHTKLSIGV